MLLEVLEEIDRKYVVNTIKEIVKQIESIDVDLTIELNRKNKRRTRRIDTKRT
jgi:hypothetical protein